VSSCVIASPQDFINCGRLSCSLSSQLYFHRKQRSYKKTEFWTFIRPYLGPLTSAPKFLTALTLRDRMSAGRKDKKRNLAFQSSFLPEPFCCRPMLRVLGFTAKELAHEAAD
jgi:hypothetical protein